MVRRRIDSEAGQRALLAWQAGDTGAAVVAAAVRHTLALLAERAPGNSVEVRVPPYGAVQVIPGVSHRRGTPPAVVQMNADVWLALVSGTLAWADGLASGGVVASGERSDLGVYLPFP